jgi:hypothetical protein
MAKNQCDGCRAGMVLRDGNHYTDSGKLYMGCTAHRYSRLCAAGCGQTIEHAWAKDHHNLCSVCEWKGFWAKVDRQREIFCIQCETYTRNGSCECVPPFPPVPHAEIPGARTTDNGECNIAY